MSLLLLACSCSPVGSTPQSESESESESDSPVDTPVDTELEGPHIPSFELAQGFVPIGLGRAVSVQDVDGDGDLDVLSASSGMAQPGNSSLQLHLQNPDGSYTWATESWGLSYDLDLWGLVPIDPDGDGVNQLLMTGAGWSGIAGNHLLTLSPFGSVLEGAPRGACGDGASMGASVADFDQNGFLDLVIANGSAHEWGGCTDVLFNPGDRLQPSFQVGSGELQGFGTVSQDLSGDGFPELVVLGGTGCTIYQNAGEEPWFYLDDPDYRFFERVRTEEQDQNWPIASLTTVLLDYDQDGDLDVYVCSFGDPKDESLGDYQVLLRNDGDMAFVNVAPDVGAAIGGGCMGVGTGDIDLNGYPDLYLGTGGPEAHMASDNLLLLNSGGQFQDVATQAGVAWKGRTHGIEFADMNQDGHMDLVANSGGAMPGQEEGLRVALNQGGPYAGVPVVLEGPPSNPDGVGTRIQARTEQGNFYSWRIRGQGFASSNLGPTWVGVGDAQEVTVIARFPDGSTAESAPLSPPFETLTLRWEE